MNLFQTIRKHLSIGGPSFNSPSWLWSSGINPDRKNKLYTTEEVSTLSAVYRSCTLYADLIGAAQWDVIKQSTTGGHTRVAGSDIQRALSNWEFCEREMWVFSACLLGNGYAEIIRNDRGAPHEIQTIASWRVSPEWRNEKLVYRIHSDENVNDSSERIVPESDMLHLRYRLTGRHGVLGEAPVSRMVESLDAVLRTREGQRNVWRNMSAPTTYLSSPKPLPVESAKRLKTAYEEFLSKANLGGTLILDNEISLNTVNIGELANLQCVELMQHGVEEVSRIFGVPASLLSQTVNVNNSTAIQERRNFVTVSLSPFAKRVQDELSKKFFTRTEIGAGMSVRIDLLKLLLEAGEDTANYYSKLLNAGLMTVNEARNQTGLEDITDGDILRSPLNTAPLPFWAHDFKPGASPEKPDPDTEDEKQLSTGRQQLQKIMGKQS